MGRLSIDDASVPRRPLGGGWGVVAALIVQAVCVSLAFALGAVGGWAWSWMLFLAVPAVNVVVYGMGSRRTP